MNIPYPPPLPLPTGGWGGVGVDSCRADDAIANDLLQPAGVGTVDNQPGNIFPSWVSLYLNKALVSTFLLV